MDMEAKPKAATTSSTTNRGNSFLTVGWRTKSRIRAMGSAIAWRVTDADKSLPLMPRSALPRVLMVLAPSSAPLPRATAGGMGVEAVVMGVSQCVWANWGYTGMLRMSS